MTALSWCMLCACWSTPVVLWTRCNVSLHFWGQEQSRFHALRKCQLLLGRPSSASALLYEGVSRHACTAVFDATVAWHAHHQHVVQRSRSNCITNNPCKNSRCATRTPQVPPCM
eukprot:362747-Chlamydomonas_euryale.AAC.2